LVTGDTGFVGRHALKMWPQAHGLAAAAAEHVDLRDKVALCKLLTRVQPQEVVHLAGISFVPYAVQNPRLTYEVNFLGTLNLLEALAETGFRGRFLFVSSGDAYGLVPAEDLPVRETQPLKPRNPYAVSKAAAESLCYQWSQTGPFQVVVARPFNHIGAGQSAQFAISDFARQIAEIAIGRRDPVLQVGNIDVTRDFSDVRDVLAAYEMLLAKGANGSVYNVCSGVERSVRSLVERLLELANVRADVVSDMTRWRPAEQARVFASHDKLTECTGWKPVQNIDDTLLNLYRYWGTEIDK
jgi:GDP-4-dehydro-6-deoxy-D-mannose reductase